LSYFNRRPALSGASTFPDHIIAAVSFHGSRFVTSQVAPGITEKPLWDRVSFGVADGDRLHTPKINKLFTAAFGKAKVPNTIEECAGASYGFAIPNNPAYLPFSD
jgi:hypothetical protein